MIEKESAVENLEALLSVGGVDMVQFGPGDYSMSLGVPGQKDDPRVVEAERYVIETSMKMGVAPRAELNHPDEAQKYLDMGVKHFCMGTDVTILYQWFLENGDKMRNLMGLPQVDREKRGRGYNE